MKLFISLEGVECTGKSTAIHLLSELLSMKNISYSIKTELPIGSRLIEDALSKSIFISEGMANGPLSTLFFMLYHEASSILSTNQDVDLVIADRFIDSVAIYQGTFLVEQDTPADIIYLLNEIEALLSRVGIPIPETTFLFQASEQDIITRFHQREGRQLKTIEIERIMNFQTIYRQISRSKPRYHLIDSSNGIRQGVDEIMDVIIKQIES